jgi:AcrR family transcriptional regulator
MAKNATGRELRGARARKDILDAAERLFAQRGYAGMTVAQLSEASGLPVSSIYWHFGSKDGVLAAVLEQGLQAFSAARRRAADYEGEPLQRFAQMLEETAAQYDAAPAYLRLPHVLALAPHEGTHDARRLVREMRESALRSFEEALRPILAPDGGDERLALVRETAVLCRATADGAFLASFSQEDVSVVRVFRTLVTLVEGLVPAAGEPGG